MQHEDEKRGRTKTRHARRLSAVEIALWRHVTADVTPRVKTLVLDEIDDVAPAPAAQQEPIPANSNKNAPVAPSKTKSQPSLHPIVPLDRRLKRRLFSGKEQVDDVIDLHGMTQARAHQALNEFIWRAARSGSKLVLVITGKGAPQRDDDYASERGVLKRQTPHWLRDPALRGIVLSVEEAGRPHGGAGALYVRLRRRISER
jgi:DNA-nicking Smr family endonuclease